MVKFTDWVLDKILTLKGLIITGAEPLTLQDSVWVELEPSAMSYNPDTSRGKVDYDYTNATINLNENADLNDSRDAFIVIYEINHIVDLANNHIRPHLHFLQSQADLPDFKVSVRRLNNKGEAIEDWWDLPKSSYSTLHSYTSGTISQMFNFGDIDMSNLGMSAQLQLKVWRDSNNETNPEIQVHIIKISSHINAIKLGSNNEYTN